MWLSLLCWVARWPRRTQCVHPTSRSLRPSPRMPIRANILCYFCRSPLSHSCADCGLLELRRRRALADRAAAAQAVAAPPRPNPSARACCCRRRRRSTRCPCVVRVALCMCMSCVCGLIVTLEPLSMIVDGTRVWMVAGGPAGGWLLILLFIYLFIYFFGYIGFRAHPSRQPISLLAETYGDRSITSGCLFEAVGGRLEGPGFESLLDPYVFIYI